MNGGLIELLIILAIILFGLFGKKKRPPIEEEEMEGMPPPRQPEPGRAGRQAPQRRAPRSRVPQPTTQQRAEPPRRPVPAPEPRPEPIPTIGPDLGSLAEELDRLLRHRAEPEPLPEPIYERPIISLEETEIDDEERHRIFHERLAETHAPPRVIRRRGPGLTLDLDRDQIRQAIVWREVLGPPVGLR